MSPTNDNGASSGLRGQELILNLTEESLDLLKGYLAEYEGSVDA